MNQTILYTLIFLLGTASYIVGAVEILQGKYKPSMFSRTVWLLLAVNAFAGVLGSGGTTASILLGAVLLAGSTLIWGLSLWKGNKTFGKLEGICLGILALSVYIWIVYDAPFISLLMSLFGDLIGGIPTLRNAWEKPKNESRWFWGLFFFSSLLSVLASRGSPWTAGVLALYFTCFDGLVFALSLRRGKLNS